MYKKFQRIYRDSDKYTFYSISLTLLTTFITITLYALNLSRLPSKIPMFYSLPWGEPQLVSLSQFFILPLMLLLITLVNLVLSWQLHSSQYILKRIINLSTLLMALLVLLTSYKIIHIFV